MINESYRNTDIDQRGSLVESSAYVRQQQVEDQQVDPRPGSYIYHVRPSEVRAKERMLRGTVGEATQSVSNGLDLVSKGAYTNQMSATSMSNLNIHNGQVLNKVLTLAKTYDPNLAKNGHLTPAKENKGSIIKIIDNKITDYAPRHLSSSSSPSSSSSSSPSCTYANKSFKNETQIQLHSASSANTGALIPTETAIHISPAPKIINSYAHVSQTAIKDLKPTHIEINFNVSN